MLLADGTLLTYCTNIHPGESWPDVFASLQRHLPPVKAAVMPEAPFGIGLRLSADAAQGLRPPEALAAFRDFLAVEDLFVFTINGFPYGAFHGQRCGQKIILQCEMTSHEFSEFDRHCQFGTLTYNTVQRGLWRILPKGDATTQYPRGPAREDDYATRIEVCRDRYRCDHVDRRAGTSTSESETAGSGERADPSARNGVDP